MVSLGQLDTYSTEELCPPTNRSEDGRKNIGAAGECCRIWNRMMPVSRAETRLLLITVGGERQLQTRDDDHKVRNPVQRNAASGTRSRLVR